MVHNSNPATSQQIVELTILCDTIIALKANNPSLFSFFTEFEVVNWAEQRSLGLTESSASKMLALYLKLLRGMERMIGLAAKMEIMQNELTYSKALRQKIENYYSSFSINN